MYARRISHPCILCIMNVFVTGKKEIGQARVIVAAYYDAAPKGKIFMSNRINLHICLLLVQIVYQQWFLFIYIYIYLFVFIPTPVLKLLLILNHVNECFNYEFLIFTLYQSGFDVARFKSSLAEKSAQILYSLLHKCGDFQFLVHFSQLSLCCYYIICDS